MAGLDPHATIMGFDFGEKRIGVAIGSLSIGVASALTTIHAESNVDRLFAVGNLVRDWRPVQLVVGEPAYRNGEPHPIAHLAKKFGNRLTENFKLPVAYINEFLTSTEAAVFLAEKGIKGRNQKEKIDAVAAQIILQSWLDDQKRVSHAA